MTYFLYSLILCLLLSLCLFTMLLYRMKINVEYKNRHAVSYFLPVILTVAFLYFSITITVPRILDVPALLSGNLSVKEAIFETENIGRRSINADELDYYYGFGLESPDNDKPYRIEYTPRSRYIIKLEQIESSGE